MAVSTEAQNLPSQGRHSLILMWSSTFWFSFCHLHSIAIHILSFGLALLQCLNVLIQPTLLAFFKSDLSSQLLTCGGVCGRKDVSAPLSSKTFFKQW